MAALVAGAVVAGSTVSAAGPTGGEPLRLALIDPPDRLAEALHAGMAAWGVAVVVVEAAPDDRDPARGAALLDERAARAIAAEHAAGAVVWVSSGAQHELWVLDLARPTATHQRLAPTLPFDDVTAAAAALSVKALLRNGGLDPETRAAVGLVAAPPPAIRR